jgi:hypothetical protein
LGCVVWVVTGRFFLRVARNLSVCLARLHLLFNRLSIAILPMWELANAVQEGCQEEAEEGQEEEEGGTQ